MAIIVVRRRSPARPRRRGERANLQRETVLKLCRDRANAGKPLTMAAIAAELKVAPNTIYAQFERGVATIEAELSREALVPLGRTIRPKEDWKGYLRSLFAEAHALKIASPAIARMIPPSLAVEPYLCPRLSERVLYCLTAAGVSAPKNVACMTWVMAVFTGALNPAPIGSKPQDRSDWVDDLEIPIIGSAEADCPLLKAQSPLTTEVISDLIGHRPDSQHDPIGLYADLVVAAVVALTQAGSASDIDDTST